MSLWARPAAPQKDAAGRRCASFSPLACPNAQLFQSLTACEHCLRGFTNRDIRAQLAPAFIFVPAGTIPQSKAPRSAKVLLARSGLEDNTTRHSVHHRSPIDVPSLTGDLVARLGREEQRQAGDVVRTRDATSGRKRQHRSVWVALHERALAP